MSYVLVVDDEAPIRTVLRRRLEGWGYTVREAANPAEALELISEPPAIALIDVHMPGEHDGTWLAAQIRQRWNTTVIIIVSGSIEVASLDLQRSLGVVDLVLHKPFDSDVLRDAVQRARRATSDGDALHDG